MLPLPSDAPEERGQRGPSDGYRRHRATNTGGHSGQGLACSGQNMGRSGGVWWALEAEPGRAGPACDRAPRNMPGAASAYFSTCGGVPGRVLWKSLVQGSFLISARSDAVRQCGGVC